MTLPEKISADYTLRPSELAAVLALLVEARQPCIVWGPPGAAKSQIAQQVPPRRLQVGLGLPAKGKRRRLARRRPGARAPVRDIVRVLSQPPPGPPRVAILRSRRHPPPRSPRRHHQYLTTPARALTLLNVRTGRAALQVRVDRPDLHENEGQKNARRNNIIDGPYPRLPSTTQRTSSNIAARTHTGGKP